MAGKPELTNVAPDESGKLRIYFLPNLFTAGNLFCGFIALTRIVEADINGQEFTNVIRWSLFFILLACIFDVLDGRVARLGGFESPFGREFDSLADLISFGVAPAFLVHRVVLRDVFFARPEVGWFISSIYLMCGALRLARFNCLAAMPPEKLGHKDFTGLPIPAAAGTVASITLLLLHLDDKSFPSGSWRYLLPFIMVFLSIMMVSDVRFPSFKSLDWRAKRSFARMVIIVLAIGFFLILWNTVLPWVLPIVFTAYIFYGFIRPHIPGKMRKEIEDEEGEDEAENNHG
jgi:CDP-diacylglycerol---serine O-phosphatidyltransferase